MLSETPTSICTVQSICCQGASLARWAFLISSTPASCGGARLTALTGSWTESFQELQVLVLQSRQNCRGSIPINSMEKQNWCACHLPRTARALTWFSEEWILQHKVWLWFEKVCRYWVEILTFPVIWYDLWILFSMTNADCFLYRTWACNRERERQRAIPSNIEAARCLKHSLNKQPFYLCKSPKEQIFAELIPIVCAKYIWFYLPQRNLLKQILQRSHYFLVSRVSWMSHRRLNLLFFYFTDSPHPGVPNVPSYLIYPSAIKQILEHAYIDTHVDVY